MHAPIVTDESLRIEVRPDFGPNIYLPRHRWYRFKEGFSAGLVQEFITSNFVGEEPKILLDPFLGSGTTALEGAQLGHRVDGIEINPFMAFMANVKTRDYSNAKNIESAALQCFKSGHRDKSFALPNDTTLVERKKLKKWILNKGVARRFEQLRTGIAKVESKLIRDLLLLALISSIEDVANAKKDGKCWRYKKNWEMLGYDGVALDDAFAARVIEYIEDILTCPRLEGIASIVTADSRKYKGYHYGTPFYDGILTSPPYLNSFDYTDIYRPELFLLSEARSSRELRFLRHSTLRSHVQVAWKESPSLRIPLLQRTIKEIDSAGLWNTRIPQMINAYFVDLDHVVMRCATRLKKGAVVGFVVADSAYCGVVIPVGAILRRILQQRGFALRKTKVFRRTLGNGHHQLLSNERLKEVMVCAEYIGCCERS
jgi:hypothetical protein